MTVFFMRRPPEEHDGPRIGFTVSRALGGAVQRNRIRRRMREAVRAQLNRLTAPVDVVINPKRVVLEAEFVQLTSEVARAFDVVQRKTSDPGSPRVEST
jgi:ribonuclease P protein component